MINKQARFLLSIQKEPCLYPELGECWAWLGNRDNRGYGRFCRKKAHRYAYEHYVGPIPEGGHIAHKCDYPACVNPEHLFLTDRMGNNADRIKKGRTAHKLSKRDVRLIRAGVADGLFTMSTLAELFNVHPSTISKIVSHKRQPDVEGQK